MQKETKELVPLKAQVSRLENQSESIVISTPEEYNNAVDIVSKLKSVGKEIREKKESMTKPLNEALKNIRSLFAPVEEQFDNAERVLKNKLLAYKKQRDAEVAAEEAKIAARVESGTMKLETAERKVGAIERVESTTRGKVGEAQIRKIKKVRITDESLIPRQYLVPDMVAIRRDALGGKPIEGVEVYDEETVAGRINK